MDNRERYLRDMETSKRRSNRPCAVRGCSEPRFVWGNGCVASRCHEHQLETQRRSQRRQMTDPATGEIVTASNLWGRRLVPSPETGALIKRGILSSRHKVIDPVTGEVITRTALASRRRVIDPETGESISVAALRHRQKVIDPETGRVLSKSALDKLIHRRRVGYQDAQDAGRRRRESRAGLPPYPRMNPWPSDCQCCHKPIDPTRKHGRLFKGESPDPLAETVGHEPPLSWLRSHLDWDGSLILRPEHWACNMAKNRRPDWERTT
jgi:hypothetical protein